MLSSITSIACPAVLRGLGPILVLGAFAACADDMHQPATPTGPTPAPAFGRGGNGDNNGRIVFATDRDPGFDYEIYSMNPDGTGVSRLTYSPASDLNPALSPDGKKIVFESRRDDPLGEIYVMNTDGTGVSRLTYSAGLDVNPAWSKDGKQIAFASARNAADPTTEDLNDLDIHVMNADGSGVTPLTNRAGVDEHPSWSPDGKQIAFVSGTAADKEDVYTMHADGSQVSRVTFFDSNAPVRVAWSPGGKQLAVSTTQVYVVNVDGTQLSQLTYGSANMAPSWSADAKQIAFESMRDGNREIYTMNADGSAFSRRTISPAFDISPFWGR